MSYGPEHIRRLKGLEAVRKRPAMYVYDTAERGLHHLIRELFDNSVDEALNDYASSITVTILPDGKSVSVEDNGRGIPVDESQDEPGVSTLQIVCTDLHAGGKFEEGAFQATGGLHGVGLKCVNALSDAFEIEVWRIDPKYKTGHYAQKFSKGLPLEEVRKVAANTRKHGTRVCYSPDLTIFESGLEYNADTIASWCETTAFLVPRLKITFDDQRPGGEKREFYSEEGVAAYVRDLTQDSEYHAPSTPLVFEHKNEEHNIWVQVAMQWTDADGKLVYGYANNIRNSDGGRHVDGLENTLPRLVNKFGKGLGLLKEKDPTLTKADCLAGLVAVVNCRVVQPQFQGQTKDRLMTPAAETAVSAVTVRFVTEFFEKNPAVVKAVVERAQLAQRIRVARTKASESVKRQSVLGNRLPGKLADCESDDNEHTELFFVEGDSAGGGAKMTRDPRRQAILSLKGKVINVERYDLERLLANEEVKAIIGCVGTGIGDDFNIDSRRYGKYILMTDADDDGLHIRSLLLTLFQRFMPDLIESGRVYIAQPPLYRVEKGGKTEYCHSDAEMEKAKNRFGEKAKVIRFKGLGEMNPDELGHTTMQVGTRHLLQVTMPDKEAAVRMTATLMGDSPAARKAHIIKRAAYIKVED
jgi:DNA gyrase subunit B